VRIAPDELAFTDPSAWRDIMHRRSDGGEMAKNPKFYRPVPQEGIGGPDDIVFSGIEEHAHIRKKLAPGFSERTMRAQQSAIMEYVDLLIRRLHEKSGNGTKVLNIGDWYNFTTFDVIGHLAFGEPFDCLNQSDYHPWVKAIFELGHIGTFFQAASHYPMLQRLIFACIPKSAMKRREHHTEFTRAKLRRRLELGKNQGDLVDGMLDEKGDYQMGFDKLEANSSLLIIAGSETTATLLAGVTYYLLMNPASLERLTKEVRRSFRSEAEIDLTSAGQLSYMLACLDEALRMYPPVPLGLPRIVPAGGATIAGHFIPEGVCHT
jgi:cytochrome P450